MIKQFDKNNLQALRLEMNAALASLEAKHGVKFRVGNCTYTAQQVTYKLEVGLVNENGAVETKDRESFRINAPLYGFEKDDLDKQIVYGGKLYRIDGLRTTSWKNPITIKEIKTGKSYQAPANAVLRAMGRKVEGMSAGPLDFGA